MADSSALRAGDALNEGTVTLAQWKRQREEANKIEYRQPRPPKGATNT